MTEPTGAQNPKVDGLFDDVPSGGDERNDLTSVEGVEAVMRALGGSVIEFRGKYLETGKPPAPAEQFMEGNASRLAKAFLGEDADYHTAAWNSIDQLGVALGPRVGISGEPREVVEAYLIKFQSDLIEIMVKHEGDLDGEAAQFAIEVLVEEAVYALLGLPLSAD